MRFLADTMTEGRIKIMRSDNFSDIREEFVVILYWNKIERKYMPPGVGEINGIVEEQFRLEVPLSK